MSAIPQQTSEADASSGALFERLFDDAAIFPPGRAPLPQAVADHLARRDHPVGRYVGPFVCTAARWSELVAALPDLTPGERPLNIALIMPAELGELASIMASAALEPRVAVVSVDLPLVASPSRDLMEVRALLPDGPTGYVEFATHVADDALIAGLAAAGLRLKVRTGGLAAEDFPSDVQLASFIDRAVAHGVPFKLTAGLHRVVRHTDVMTGFEHHGFLNVILATAASLGGADLERVRRLLGERDPMRVAAAVSDLPADLAASVRQQFCSFGTCSIEEPLADLVGLRLVGAVTR